MNNYKEISEKYYITFYSTKENVSFTNMISIGLLVSVILFLYSVLLYFSYVLRFNFLGSTFILKTIIFLHKFSNLRIPLTTFTVISEATMLLLANLIKEHKTNNIKKKLYINFKLKLKEPVNIYKQRWLCKTFNCFEHELADKAQSIFQQLEISLRLKKTESFSIQKFMELVYNKDSKPRILALFLALVSLSLGLLSKDPHFKPEVIYELLNLQNLSFDFVAALLLIGMTWFFNSLFHLLKEFFSQKSDMTKLLISDMIFLNELNTKEIN
nr:hypothetical protein [uncultured Tolumonas sp.]